MNSDNLNRMRLRIKQCVGKIEDFNKEMSHNFLIIANDSVSYKGEWYGPPDPQPGYETHSFMRIMGFETIEQVQEYLLEETKNNPNKISNYKVIQVAKYLEPKTSVSISL